MTYQDVDGASVLPKLIDQITTDGPIDTISDDGAYDWKLLSRDHRMSGIAIDPPTRRSYTLTEETPGADRRNRAINVIARIGLLSVHIA